MTATTPGRGPGFRRVVAAALASAAMLAGLAGCSAESEERPAVAPSRAPSSEAPEPPGSNGPASSPRPTTDPRGPALTDFVGRVGSGSRLRLGSQREQTASYTSYDASYRADGLRLTGVVNVPRGRGPFPAVVLAHGYIDPAVYVSGQGMTRERGVLADRGYLAFHVDYRNHAGSDDDPRLVRDLYLGYALDALGAAEALRRSDLPVAGDRIALMGRSMGGSVVLQALELDPGAVSAGIVYSGQSSLEAENFARWGSGDSGWAGEFARRWGTPAEAPGVWRRMSTRPHAERITEPVLMIHGTWDEQCPPSWARATYRALERAGVDARLDWFQDQHAFGPQFAASMERVDSFLRSFLRDPASRRGSR